ncbi:MAG: hypothetical protein R3E48_14380 [Burkholderiaceae bacterium]
MTWTRRRLAFRMGPRVDLPAPPAFFERSLQVPLPDRLSGARVLGWFGDMLTTDHISPAGEIAPDSAAGRYLGELGVSRDAFNAFTMRRGNHAVMLRGTFANSRLHNRLAPDAPPGHTRHWPDGVLLPMHEAAERYRTEGVPLVVIGGATTAWARAVTGPPRVRDYLACARYWRPPSNASIAPTSSRWASCPLLRVRRKRRDLGLHADVSLEISAWSAGVRSRPVEVEARVPSRTPIRFQVRAAVLADTEAALLEGGGMFARVLATRIAGAG